MLISILRYLIIAYISLILFAVFFTKPLLYPRHPSSYRDTPAIIKIKTQDQHVISAHYLKTQKKPEVILLYSHGNAGDLGWLNHYLKQFVSHGFSVFAYDYSGYGTSTGTPTEHTTYHDIEAAYRYMTQTLKIKPGHIIAYGRSLGSGPTLELAQHHRLGGIIIEGGFVNAFQVITHVPLLPFSPYQNIKKIKHIKRPILIIHAIQDQVIPFWHGQALYDAAPWPKYKLWLENAGHNTLLRTQNKTYWRALKEFVQTIKHKHIM